MVQIRRGQTHKRNYEEVNTIIIKKNENGNEANGRQPVEVNGTPGELKGMKPGQPLKVAWNPDRPAIVGIDGRLWYVVEE